jgi:NAD-dependent deacetylase
VAADQVQRARQLIDAAAAVTVLTGAGISTDSGIPDFRGPNGVWTRNPRAERLSSLEHYLADPEVRRLAWQSRLTSPTWQAQPNAGHRAIVELERRDKLHTLVTQNIDELHQRAGTSPDKVVEIHGTMRHVVCMSCGARQPMETVLERVRGGEDDPACRDCGGILKSATISFGQNLVERDLYRAQRAAEECDLLLAVGSSLSVYPAAGLVPIAAQRGAAIVIVNGEPTPYDDLADAVVDQPISEVLPTILGGSRPPAGGAPA